LLAFILVTGALRAVSFAEVMLNFSKRCYQEMMACMPFQEIFNKEDEGKIYNVAVHSTRKIDQ
jgi:hypothetical protein